MTLLLSATAHQSRRNPGNSLDKGMESCNLTFIKYSLFFICLAGSNFQLLQHVASLVYHYHRSPSVSQWAKDNEFWQMILLVAVCHVADQSRRRPQRWPFCPWWRAPRLLSSGSPVWNLTSVQMISCLSFKQLWHGDIKHLLYVHLRFQQRSLQAGAWHSIFKIEIRSWVLSCYVFGTVKPTAPNWDFSNIVRHDAHCNPTA